MEIMFGARPGGGGGCGISMNKKISCGGNSFPYEGIFFYVGAVISLHVEAIFSMWWVSFSVCFGGYFWSCPPLTIFLREPILLSHFFYITDIYFFPDRGGFNFLRELIFFFSWEGGGIKRGWSTFEHIYIVSQGACRARGVGYRVMIVV